MRGQRTIRVRWTGWEGLDSESWVSLGDNPELLTSVYNNEAGKSGDSWSGGFDGDILFSLEMGGRGSIQNLGSVSGTTLNLTNSSQRIRSNQLYNKKEEAGDCWCGRLSW